MPPLQSPLGSRFGPTSTASEVIDGIDLQGRVAVVTGGYSGIGLEATRALSRAGATVIVPARDPGKAREALAAIDRVEVAELDLANPSSIGSFTTSFLSRGCPLHLLVNNAGIMAVPLQRDRRGHELHLATNHLGPFELTVRLWPALLRAGEARVAILSSGAHRRASFDFDDPDFERRKYDKWIAYAQSKTASVLFAVALDRRGQTHGIRAFAVHPGRIETGLQRAIPMEELKELGLRDAEGHIPESQRSLYKTVEQGAATTVWCATSSELDGIGGVYCEDVNIAAAVPATHEQLSGVLPWAIDPDAAERLWTFSEKLTGVKLSS
ncbi:oxidoreductase [Paraburkholderia strydomiana]|uniref:oxidoreductase n=1 Tax=Paraburkholderia strydomiana TaxID=1245417 RepID=UPI00285D73CB|nr:oxidoreductase [Paraburkholderia strydomiana]MDR7009309.1 NAD(P)-dependent dehydrogenase (short-subunit alcohol dehydrogenase family) [Paraburkholderia strydomiana]